MTLERKPEDLETIQDTTSWDFEEPAPVAVSEPTVPTGLPESEREELRSRAEGLASELADAEGVKEMELIDNVTNLGMQAQKNGGKQLELLRVRVGDLISESGSDSNLASGLVDLRMALNEIDPNQMSRPGVLRSITSVFPFVGVIVPPINVLKKIAMKYEPVSRQIVAIEGRLRDGRMVLTRDNVELRQLYEQVDAQRLPIQKNAYLGELLLGRLQDRLDETQDPVKAERMREALYDVSMRVQTLRVMDQVYEQFTVGIRMTRQNNSRLGRAVEQTLSISTNVITVGLAIQAALFRERRVMAIYNESRRYMGDLIVANALQIKQHTAEIGEVYSQPVIAMEKITQAHEELKEAMKIAANLKQEGIESARENIKFLNAMSGDLHKSLATADRNEVAGSIEA